MPAKRRVSATRWPTRWFDAMREEPPGRVSHTIVITPPPDSQFDCSPADEAKNVGPLGQSTTDAPEIAPEIVCRDAVQGRREKQTDGDEEGEAQDRWDLGGTRQGQLLVDPSRNGLALSHRGGHSDRKATATKKKRVGPLKPSVIGSISEEAR